jgi:hypothetical protein
MSKLNLKLRVWGPWITTWISLPPARRTSNKQQHSQKKKKKKKEKNPQHDGSMECCSAVVVMSLLPRFMRVLTEADAAADPCEDVEQEERRVQHLS